jgi:hypothetical protein
MIVTRFGSTLMCFSKIGNVHRATAPKPTNKIRFENVSIRYPVITIRNGGQAKQGTPRQLRVANHTTSTSRLFD